MNECRDAEYFVPDGTVEEPPPLFSTGISSLTGRERGYSVLCGFQEYRHRVVHHFFEKILPDVGPAIKTESVLIGVICGDKKAPVACPGRDRIWVEGQQ